VYPSALFNQFLLTLEIASWGVKSIVGGRFVEHVLGTDLASESVLIFLVDGEGQQGLFFANEFSKAATNILFRILSDLRLVSTLILERRGVIVVIQTFTFRLFDFKLRLNGETTRNW
jgi:hypothetical protein